MFYMVDRQWQQCVFLEATASDCTNRLNSRAYGQHMQHTLHAFPSAAVTLETRQKERNRAEW